MEGLRSGVYTSDTSHYRKDLPFELPQGWVWTTLGEICFDFQYGTSNKSDKQGKVAVLRMGNLQNGEIDYSDLAFTSNIVDIVKYGLKPNELLFNRTNSPEWVGKTAIYCGEIPAIFAGYIIRVIPIFINPFFLNNMMNSVYHQNLCAQTKTDGVNQSNINAQKLSNFIYPLPPLPEQHRIVSIIESTFALIDEIEANKQDLAKFIKQAKYKVLDLAIRGKLVPQNPNDKPASELLNGIKGNSKEKRPTSDISHYPFEVPEGWVWCRLGELCDYGSCTNIASSEIPSNAWILDLEDIGKGSGKLLHRIVKDNRKTTGVRHIFLKGDVLYSKLRTYLNKVLVADLDGFCTTEILPLNFKGSVIPEYARHVLMSKMFLDYTAQCGYGVKMPRLGTTDGKKALFPLPPSAEQKRIVERIETIFQALDSIQNNL